ncbi:MAG TPA: hypothetical protein PKH80_06865 [Methanofastidiosum sp.]|nr:hypothetical protein [Methanofastidiosum sp.]
MGKKKDWTFIIACAMIIIIIISDIFVIPFTYKNFPRINPTNVYWLYSSVMQLNGGLIGLFFVSLSIAISKKKSLVDFLGLIASVYLFVATGVLVIITMMCCFGLFHPEYLVIQLYILSLEIITLTLLLIIVSSIALRYIKIYKV